jgi:hypothetical protein
MPTVKSPALLAAVYNATLRQAGNAPTTLMPADSTFFRAFDQTHFTVDTQRRMLRRDQAMNALVIRDQHSDQNRFTGLSHDPRVPSCGGLYCALQQQALVNEVAHYVEAARTQSAANRGAAAPKPVPRTAVFNTKAAVKIRALGPVLAVDLSPHNPFAMSFVNSVGGDGSVQSAMKAAGKGSSPFWDTMNDGVDCSVARGLGLALAKHGYEALCVQTVRTSERSLLERGDNLIFFGYQGQVVRNLSIVEAYLFPVVGSLEVYPVEF